MENHRIDDTMLQKVTGGGSPNDPFPPFKCPCCGGEIRITVWEALTNEYVYCPHCKLRIALGNR